MSYAERIKEEVFQAWKFLREKNTSIPSDTIDYIRDAAIASLGDGIIYVVEGESGEYEDRHKYFLYVGTNLTRAFDIAKAKTKLLPEDDPYKMHHVYVSLFKNGIMVSEISNCDGDKWEWQYGKDQMQIPTI